MCKNADNSTELKAYSNKIPKKGLILVPFKLDFTHVLHLAKNVIRSYCVMNDLPKQLNELEEWGVHRVRGWGIKEDKDICVYIVHNKQRHEIIFSEDDTLSKEPKLLLKQFQYLSCYGLPEITIYAVVFSRKNKQDTLSILLKYGSSFHDYTFIKTEKNKWDLVRSGIPS